MDERRLLTPLEAAAFLGIGRTLLYRLIGEGKLPTVRVGSRTRISSAALDRWIDEQGSPSRAKAGR